MSRQTILVIDDEPDIRALVKDILEDEGFNVDVAESASEARAKLAAKTPDLVLLDIWMSDEDGISLLREWTDRQLKVFPVVVMSGHGTVETAVEATRLGADSFVEKPLTLAKLLNTVRQALRIDKEDAQASSLIRAPAGSSAIVQALRKKSKWLAQTDKNILIIGEQGMRKDVLGRYIHSLGAHAGTGFIEYGNGPMPSGLSAHSVLFVDFTVAESVRKLLEYLKRETLRDIRLMFSMYAELKLNKDEIKLLKLSRAAEIYLPPLREHIEDIPEILNDSVDYHCQRYQFAYRRFTIAAQNHLLHYDWPGNLRELDELVYRLLKSGGKEEISTNEIERLSGMRQVDDAWFEEAMSKPMREAREMFESIYLKHQLEKANGSVKRLADNIGMERTHLYRKLRTLGINYSDTGK